VNYVPDDDLIESVCLENEKDRGKLIGKVADEKRSEKKVPVNVLSEYTGTDDAGPFGTVDRRGRRFLLTIVEGDFRADRK
jgi:hypothetical protein